MAWKPVASCAALEQGDVRAVDSCGVHYALFDIRTGDTDGAITSQPLRTFPTRVEDDVIYVDLPMAEERMP
jgi:nitrite reductase/ring-hydroxylating ferredoxin subunit